jgi:hypothetical protein
MPWVADVLRQASVVSVAFATLWFAAFSRTTTSGERRTHSNSTRRSRSTWRGSVPESTLRAGHRLVLHGLASEMLYEFLVRAKRAHTAATA